MNGTWSASPQFVIQDLKVDFAIPDLALFIVGKVRKLRGSVGFDTKYRPYTLPISDAPFKHDLYILYLTADSIRISMKSLHTGV